MATRNKAILAYLRKNGRNGGHARAKALSPERRSEIGRKAIRARWRKWRAKQRAKLST